jgi:hypothetical protein
MKKLPLVIIAVLALSTASFAQLSVGIKGGLNLANLGGDVENSDMRPSIHLGGYLNLPLSDVFSFQPELLYNSVGAKFKDGGDKLTNKLNYISIPVMFLYSFGNFNVQAGPQLSLLASAKAKYDISGQTGTEDIKDGLKGTDFGFNLGLGANFDKLNASVRYSIGLSNINDGGTGDIKNNVIQLSLGYRIFGGE